MPTLRMSPGSSRTFSEKMSRTDQQVSTLCWSEPSKSSSASTNGFMTARDRSRRSSADEHVGPGDLDLYETSDVKKGIETPLACPAAVVRRRRQEGELHRYGSPGLRATAFTVCSTANCSCPSPGLDNAQEAARPASSTTWPIGPWAENRPGTLRPRDHQRPALRLDDVRRGLRQRSEFLQELFARRPEVRRRGAAELHGLTAAGRTRKYRKHGARSRGRKTWRLASGSPPSKRGRDAPRGRIGLHQPWVRWRGQGRAEGPDGLGGQTPAVSPSTPLACRARRCT